MTSKMSLPKNYVTRTATTEASGKLKQAASKARRESMQRLRAEDPNYPKHSETLKELPKVNFERKYFSTGKRKEID